MNVESLLDVLLFIGGIHSVGCERIMTLTTREMVPFSHGLR
jgi:hypothetical protein